MELPLRPVDLRVLQTGALLLHLRVLWCGTPAGGTGVVDPWATGLLSSLAHHPLLLDKLLLIVLNGVLTRGAVGHATVLRKVVVVAKLR